jgi:hypothetical protein
MKENENQDVKIALDELRFNMKQILEFSNELDRKINYTLTAGGLIVLVTSTLQLSFSLNQSILKIAVLIVALVIYLITVAIAFYGMKPQKYHFAIASEWAEIEKEIINKPERDLILKLISGYIEQNHYNLKLNSDKSKIYKVNLILIVVIVIILFLLIPISYIDF